MKYPLEGTNDSAAHDLHIARSEREQLTALADEMRRVSHVIARGISHTGRLEGLQRQQLWVLTALLGGPRKMSSLAECSRTSQTSLTGIVDRLEERGLVERLRSAEDRRVVEVALTSVGREETMAARERMLDRIEHVLEPLTSQDRAELFRLLRKITDKHG